MIRVTITPLVRQATVEGLTASVAGALRDLQDQLTRAEFIPQRDLAMSGHRITNLSDPAAGRDAVNKNYLERRLTEVSLTGGASNINTATSTTTVVTTLAVRIAY
jgi:hypothetical protein